MKTKNQSSLPSKYWLIIVIVICVILMGVERITGGNGPISFIANYTVIPMQKGIGYVGRYMSDLSDNFETLQDMKKENKKLVEVLNLFSKDLRYFSLGGRTEDEAFALNLVLKEKPIKDTLDSYLQGLPKDVYEKLLYFNGVKDLDKLKDEIEDSFKEAIYEYLYNYSDVLIVLKKKDKKYKCDINLQLVLNGYLYLYEKDKELYIGIPKEIENIMKKIEPDDMRWRKLKSFDILDDNDWLPFN